MKSERANWNPFPAQEWIAWLGATVVAAMTMVAYAYSTFETKDSAREHQGTLVERLERMESKQDRMESKIDELRVQAHGH